MVARGNTWYTIEHPWIWYFVRVSQVPSDQWPANHKNGIASKTLSVKLWVKSIELHEYLFIWLYCTYQVKTYIRSVILCFKCRWFYHFANECRAKQRSARCGQDHTTGWLIGDNSNFGTVHKSHSVVYEGGWWYKEAHTILSVASVEGIPVAVVICLNRWQIMVVR